MQRISIVVMVIIGSLGLASQKNVLADNASKQPSTLFKTAPDAKVLANILFPDEEDTSESSTVRKRGVPMRGIAGIRESSAAQESDSTESKVANSKERTFGMAITFEFGSARLSPDSKPLIDAVASMLQLEEVQSRAILIEGHTDSIGGKEANMKLSMERAEAVKMYLVTNYNINPQRLHLSGQGETNPLYPDNPEAGENRRVQFKAL